MCNGLQAGFDASCKFSTKREVLNRRPCVHFTKEHFQCTTLLGTSHCILYPALSDNRFLRSRPQGLTSPTCLLPYTMFTPDQYQLLDFGDGRRLERFGGIVLDRPCPAAEKIERADPGAWADADARFDRTDDEEGQWSSDRDPPDRWTIAHGSLRFELKRTDFGHLGLFPEQADNWQWLGEQIAAASRPLQILNLFAYTGGSTLAAALAGAEVVHVDAAKNVVAWARRNMVLSDLSELPIRWIVDDAQKFVRRELKRGNGYDGIILDPPSYGHGVRGEVWRLSKHLPRLLTLCGQLTAGRCCFVLLTCHTPGFDAARLSKMMRETIGSTSGCTGADAGTVTAWPLSLASVTGRSLPSGVAVCWLAKRRQQRVGSVPKG
jgi:23S rRNA (cytosine1962-C5)-methyltransferase